MYKNMLTGIDPKLEERYRAKNAYSFVEFRHAKLPKANYIINAGQAWHGLKDAWIGYRTSLIHKDGRSVMYASAIQKFSDLLDLEIPDFSAIGLSKEGYNAAKILKEFINPNEIVGDEPII
jgi:hypothetical protein